MGKQPQSVLWDAEAAACSTDESCRGSGEGNSRIPAKDGHSVQGGDKRSGVGDEKRPLQLPSGCAAANGRGMCGDEEHSTGDDKWLLRALHTWWCAPDLPCMRGTGIEWLGQMAITMVAPRGQAASWAAHGSGAARRPPPVHKQGVGHVGGAAASMVVRGDRRAMHSRGDKGGASGEGGPGQVMRMQLVVLVVIAVPMRRWSRSEEPMRATWAVGNGSIACCVCGGGAGRGEGTRWRGVEVRTWYTSGTVKHARGNVTDTMSRKMSSPKDVLKGASRYKSEDGITKMEYIYRKYAATSPSGVTGGYPTSGLIVAWQVPAARSHRQSRASYAVIQRGREAIDDAEGERWTMQGVCSSRTGGRSSTVLDDALLLLEVQTGVHTGRMANVDISTCTDQGKKGEEEGKKGKEGGEGYIWRGKRQRGRERNTPGSRKCDDIPNPGGGEGYSSTQARWWPACMEGVVWKSVHTGILRSMGKARGNREGRCRWSQTNVEYERCGARGGGQEERTSESSSGGLSEEEPQSRLSGNLGFGFSGGIARRASSGEVVV
ncbi:hypothetical protein C8R44DRAFT_750973 [Mycena epipterygia]|nr:hypothetical protein C8R44DRAFT_750973 [Mycena epipterygia]